jgi:hypothetical protein
MIKLNSFFACALWCFGGTVLGAGAPDKPDEPVVAPRLSKDDEARIDTAITQLGSDTFEEREKASKYLQAAGKASVPALKRALAAAKDPEVLARVRDLLTQFDDEFETPEAGLALYARLIGKAVEKPGDAEVFAKHFERAQKVLKRVEAAIDRKDRDLRIGKAQAKQGVVLFGAAKAANHPKWLLESVVQTLDSAVDRLGRQHEKFPEDKEIEQLMTEASMMMYSARKFSTL